MVSKKISIINEGIGDYQLLISSFAIEQQKRLLRIIE